MVCIDISKKSWAQTYREYRCAYFAAQVFITSTIIFFIWFFFGIHERLSLQNFSDGLENKPSFPPDSNFCMYDKSATMPGKLGTTCDPYFPIDCSTWPVISFQRWGIKRSGWGNWGSGFWSSITPYLIPIFPSCIQNCPQLILIYPIFLQIHLY